MPDRSDRPPRILLVHPLGYSSKNAETDVSRMANIMPPLGLASIAAYLDRHGIDNDIIDCYAHPDSKTVVAACLKETKPAYIGFSCTTSSFFDGIEIAREAKRVLPDIQVIFGGVHVSAVKEQALEDFPVIDYTVVGEGEETLRALLTAKKESIPQIRGVVYREENGRATFTGHPEKQLLLDDLPFPAYDKLAGYPAGYKLPIFNYPKAPNASCISSRGCPYACSYCDRSVFQRSFRYNSAGYLYRHLEHLKEAFGIKHVNFYDDQFTFNRKRVEQFAALMVKKPLGITFNCAARAEHLDFDLLKSMKKAGCWMISLGIETGDPDLLARHRQNPDLDMMRETIRLIKRAGIRVKGLLMMGLPGETEESIRRSMDYVFSLPIDDFNLAKFTPFPGAPLYEKIHEYGDFDADYAKMDCMNFQFIPRGFSRERLNELYQLFYKTHFTRPKILWSYLTMAWKSPDSYRRFFLSLPDFLKFARSDQRIPD